MKNSFVEYLVKAGATDDFRQLGADFLVHEVDHGGTAADALRAVAAIVATGAKFSVPMRGDDGHILASRHLELDQRAALDIVFGAMFALGWRTGHDAARADPERPMPRSIGFRH